MEVYVFMITITMICALGLLCAGICIGMVRDDDKGVSKGELRDDHNCDVLCDGDSDHTGSSVGDVHRKIDSRCDLGCGCYKEGQITACCAVIGLKGVRHEFSKVLSQTEKDAIDYAVNIIKDSGECYVDFI